MKALVVDDSRLMRMMVRKQLHGCGLSDDDIEEAANGQEALDSIEEQVPDLILSDVNMPVMDGERFLYEAANTGYLDQGRVVMITSRYERKLFGRLLGCGASAIIRKPFTTDSFRRRLEPVLQEIVDARQGTRELTHFNLPESLPVQVSEAPVVVELDDEPALRAAKSLMQVLQTLGMTPKIDTPEQTPVHTAAYAEVVAQTEPPRTLTVYGDHAACNAISLATLGIPADDDERCADVLAELSNIVAGKWLSSLIPGGAIPFGTPTSGAASRDEVVMRGLRGVALGGGYLLVGVVT